MTGWHPRPWSPEALAHLGDLFGPNRETWARAVRAGVAELWELDRLDYSGWLATWIQAHPVGLVLFIGGFRGRGSAALLADLKTAARRSGCVAIECGAVDPRVQRLWTRIGFREIERTYRIDLDG